MEKSSKAQTETGQEMPHAELSAYAAFQPIAH